MSRHVSHACAATVAATLLFHLAVIFGVGCTTVTAAEPPRAFTPSEMEYTLSALRYDTEVQDFLAPTLAMSLGPMGGGVYVTSNSSKSEVSVARVCARADEQAMLAPITITTIDGLFHSITDLSGHLDVHHSCYMAHTAGDLPQCVAMLTSTAEDCGGVAADAVGPYMKRPALSKKKDDSQLIVHMGVMPSSAAMLAAYVLRWGQQRLNLERSLRRTREAMDAFGRVHTLMHNAAEVSTSKDEMSLLRLRATAYVAKIASEAHLRVMEKYQVLSTWVKPSLGITPRNQGKGQRSSFTEASHGAVGPDIVKCRPDHYMRLLRSGNGTLTMHMWGLLNKTLGLAYLLHPEMQRATLQGVECVQMLSALAMMMLEDEPIRRVSKMVGTRSLSSSTIWDLDMFNTLTYDYNHHLRSHQLRGAAHTLAILAGRGGVSERIGQTSVAKCMLRAGLVVPDNVTDTVPPSVYWCLQNTSINEIERNSVRQRSLATRESRAVAPNGQCLWGLSVWDGLCDGEAFDPARCQLCPPGSIGDGEGHCACGDAITMYPSMRDGCLAKGLPSAVPIVQIINKGRNNKISLAGDNASVKLFSVHLPGTAILIDPSCYLNVDVICDDSGRGRGGTRLVAARSGDRRALCSPLVEYERRQERTGVMYTFLDGVQRYVTYAQTLTVSATGSASFYGETCTFNVTIGSTLRLASEVVTVGALTFLPGATPLQVETHDVDVLESGSGRAAPFPLCQDMRRQEKGSVSSTAVLAGVCRASRGQLGVFVAPGSYSLFGMSTQQLVGTRVRRSAGTVEDASFISTVQSLASRTGMEVILDGTGAAGSDVLWSFTLKPDATPLSVTAWLPGGYAMVSVDILQRAHSLRVRLLDIMNTSAFEPAEGVVPFQYKHNEERLRSGLDGTGDNRGSGHKGTSMTHKRCARFCLGAIIFLSVVLTFLLAVLVIFLYLLLKTDAWPKIFLR